MVLYQEGKNSRILVKHQVLVKREIQMTQIHTDVVFYSSLVLSDRALQINHTDAAAGVILTDL